MPTIVLLAYYYPPLGGVGSQRALSFARHLPALGFDVVVVTPRRGAYGLDASLPADDALPGVRVVRTGSFEPAVLARRLRGGKATASAGGGDMVENLDVGRVGALVRGAVRATLYFPDHARGWIGPAARAAAKAARETNAVAVLSTSPPISGHVAALKAAKAAGVPAVLDFRDLWTAHRDAADESRRAKSERRLEADLLRDADAVTTVSETWRDWFTARAGVATKPFRVLRNGFEEDDFRAAPPSRDRDVFRIVHAGTVYGARQDTTAFFRALAAVRARGAFGARRVEVVLAGKVDPQCVAAARAAGCADLLVTPGFVTHDAALAMTRAATVNLLLTWTVRGAVAAGVCPGKTYELMAASRPILALAFPTCETAALLAETGGALVVDPFDEAAITAALARLAAAELVGDAASAVPPRAASIARFSRRSIARELADLLASVAT